MPKRVKPIAPVPEHPDGARDPFDTGDKDLHKAHNVNGISGEALISFIQRIERLEEERKAISDDIKEIKSEAKGSGFDISVINHILKIRKQDADDRAEFETLVDIYSRAIGLN